MKFFREPWGHQMDAITDAAQHRDFALFFEQGAGKTLTAINIARQRYYEHNRLLRTLVLCPPIVRSNWKNEWGFNSALKKHVDVLDGPGNKRAQHVAALGNSPRIVVTNYESLRNEELLKNLKAWEPELIIFDESHKCKTYNSKTTKNCFMLAKKALHRYILTGTPVLNFPSDLFSQFKILDLGDTFGRSFLKFRDEYFIDANRMKKNVDWPDWKPKANLEAVLHSKIKLKSRRVLKKDCMDLPPLVRQVIEVPMTSEQERVYTELKKDFVAYLDDKACVATLAITKAMRLLQISTGFVSLEGIDSKEEKIFKNNPRDAALAEILESIILQEEKVIVWAVFKRNYDSIRAVCKKLDYDILEIHGGVSDKKKREAVDAFSEPGGASVLLAHPASGGIGINLVSASYSVRYSRSFNLGDYLQSQARNYRGGSEVHEKVTEIELVAPGTLDQVVMEALAGKQDLATNILDLRGRV